MNGDGRLGLEPPSEDEPADTYLYDPADPVPTIGGAMLGPRAGIREQGDVEQRPDVLVYSTDPLTNDFEVTGPVTATLYVSTTAVNTDFTVKLVDVYPDGKAYNVSDGILRRTFLTPGKGSAAIQNHRGAVADEHAISEGTSNSSRSEQS